MSAPTPITSSIAGAERRRAAPRGVPWPGPRLRSSSVKRRRSTRHGAAAAVEDREGELGRALLARVDGARAARRRAASRTVTSVRSGSTPVRRAARAADALDVVEVARAERAREALGERARPRPRRSSGRRRRPRRWRGMRGSRRRRRRAPRLPRQGASVARRREVGRAGSDGGMQACPPFIGGSAVSPEPGRTSSAASDASPLAGVLRRRRRSLPSWAPHAYPCRCHRRRRRRAAPRRRRSACTRTTARTPRRSARASASAASTSRGLSPEQARAKLRSAVLDPLSRPVVVRARGQALHADARAGRGRGRRRRLRATPRWQRSRDGNILSADLARPPRRVGRRRHRRSTSTTPSARSAGSSSASARTSTRRAVDASVDLESGDVTPAGLEGRPPAAGREAQAPGAQAAARRRRRQDRAARESRSSSPRSRPRSSPRSIRRS